MSKQQLNHRINLVDYLRIINEPNRLKILYLLKKEKMCVCDIVKNLSLPQNLISHHLRVLKNFGLLSNKKDGQKVIYWRQEQLLEKYQKLLNKIIKL